jgi:ankyrin repeat protein
VEALLEAGAFANAGAVNGSTALHIAAIEGYEDIVKV